tara:strand:- start:411 stop:1154 length:744 start_codon:yes stop_codon:yes gene_type:complete
MEETSEEEVELDNFALCPTCKEEVSHQILRTTEKGKGVDHLVKCDTCNGVHKIQLRPPKSTEVRFTLSEIGDSRQIMMEIDVDEIFTLGDQFDHDEFIFEITRLEMPDATSSNRVSAEDVRMVWATRVDKVMVRLTFTEGEESFSDTIMCEPDEEFHCGAIFEHSSGLWRIRALHSGKGRSLNGKMKAANIRRVFLHLPPSYEDAQEKRRLERGSWKGQNFSGREDHQEKIRSANIRSKKVYQKHRE